MSLLTCRPHEQSCGQRQRVALAPASLRLCVRGQRKNIQYDGQVTAMDVTDDQIEAMI